jgi:hypothetical protein
LSVHWKRGASSIGEMAERLYKHLIHHKVARYIACVRVAAYYSLGHVFDQKGRCEMCRCHREDHNLVEERPNS